MNFKVIKRRRRLYEEPAREYASIPIATAELYQWVRDHPHAGPFAPGKCFHNRDGDGFEVYWKDVTCYAEDCGDVTLMKSQETDEVVGVKIWDVRRKSGLVEVTIKEPKETPEVPT